IIYMAGYIGTILFGAACLHVGRHRGAGRRGLALMAGIILVITALWIQPLSSPFGFAAGLGVGLLIAACARFMPERAAHFLASFLAVQLSLNAIYDVRDLLFQTTQTNAGNDAVFMAQAYG